MQFKGFAGIAVFRSSALLANLQVNQNWLLQIPLAPELKRYILNIILSEATTKGCNPILSHFDLISQ